MESLVEKESQRRNDPRIRLSSVKNKMDQMNLWRDLLKVSEATIELR